MICELIYKQASSGQSEILDNCYIAVMSKCHPIYVIFT